MAIFDDLSKVVNKGIGQTERMLELGRLKMQLTQYGASRNDLYMALGRVAQGVNRRTPIGNPEVDDLCERIHEIDVAIIAVEDRIAEMQADGGAGPTCASCGTVNTAGSSFCVACGTKLVGEEPPAACAKCGTALTEGAAFCVRCGTPVGSGSEPAAE